jgi:hypothetical protein
VRDAVLAAREDRAQVHVDHPLPDVVGRLEDRRVRARGDAGVVEEDVDAPEALGRLPVHPGDLLVVGDVDPQRQVDPAASSRSAPTTIAPSAANSSAVAAPIPPAAPVMTQTFPSSRPAIRPPSRSRWT